jgi:CheY-like chemotaxis protein
MIPLAGWDLIAHLRSRHPALPIFVITALPMPLEGEGMSDISAYFQKPIDLDRMIAALWCELAKLGYAQRGSSV